MKNFSILLVGLSILICNHAACALNQESNTKESQVTQTGTKALVVSSSSDVLNLTQNWVHDFNAITPDAKVTLDQAILSKAETVDHLCLTSDETSTMVNNQQNWRMVVGRDVIVPIFNAGNPMLNQLNQVGISTEKLKLLLKSGEKMTWSNIVANGQNAGIKLYIANEEVLISTLADFTNTNSQSFQTSQTAAEVIAAVKMDQFAVGFCKLSDLRTMLSSGSEMVKLFPLDKNGNGRLDNFENIYGNIDEFTHGVWVGKYPTALSANIYAVSATKPTAENEIAFLSWIMRDGQKLMNVNGYCDLTTTEKQAGLASLFSAKGGDIQVANNSSLPKSWPIALTVCGLLGLFAAIYFYSKKRVDETITEQEIQIAPLLIENAVHVPKGLYFDKTHTWAFMEKDGNVKVGMDDFLQHITGKLTKIRMKEVGESVRKGEKIVTIIRDGKQLNLYAPISGTIVKQNKSLQADSTLLNSSPYTEGWVYKIEPKNWLREIQFMLMGEKYAEWLRDEFVRLRDFVAASVKSNELAYAHVVLQDGGELTDNVLADMDPKVWEDFQTKFIDASK